MTTKSKSLYLLLIAALLGASLLTAARPAALPLTGSPDATIAAAPAAKNKLTVTKVEAPGVFTFTVQQSGNSVPSAAGVVGQYAEASKRGSIGLLAHNYLAGGSFSALKNGQKIIVTFSDGSTKTYVVYNTLTYQATDPNDFSQPFLNSKGKKMTAREVFSQAYKSNLVVFQTCIYKDGHSSWGVMFIQAKLSGK